MPTDRIFALEQLRHVHWEDGKRLVLMAGAYRHQIVVRLAHEGRQRATFADGAEHPYFEYNRLVDGKGQKMALCTDTVPVLPNNDLILVVEQRPPQDDEDDAEPRPFMMERDSGPPLDLRRFGPYSSLEFPGGGVKYGEKIVFAFLRELAKETGTEGQSATLYRCMRPMYPMGSDLAHANLYSVAFLDSAISPPERTEGDGGLAVLTLSPQEVDRNILNGVIVSGQAGIHPWNFYRQIMEGRNDMWRNAKMLDSGYLAIERVTITGQRP